MKKTILLVPLIIAASISIRAQSIAPSTLNATGGTAVIGTHEFDWSVGEMTMITTFTGSNIIVTQGLLQPATGPSAVENVSPLSKQLQVFPNPATSIVNIEFASQEKGTLSYKLMDVAGKLIAEKSINVAPGAISEQVDVSHLAAANYMLEVTVTAQDAASENISYKIQKLK